MTGGDPKQVVEIQGTSSSWSQDGKALLAEVPAPKTSPQDADASQLAFFNLESHSVASIPGSQGKSGPFQPLPQIVVASGQQNKLYVCDLSTGKWSVLADGPIYYWMPSPDLKYLYFVRDTPGNPEVLRIRFSDRKVDVIASLKSLRRIAEPLDRSSWLGVAPDGSIVHAGHRHSRGLQARTKISVTAN
jgi:dipeptidyl aminopeptidase/acylaminoacyl peptidase